KGRIEARVIVLQCQIANGSVLSATDICKKRRIAHSIVAETVNIVKQRKSTERAIEVGTRTHRVSVKHKRVCADGRVPRTIGIEQKRLSANCRLLIPRCTNKCSPD